MALVSNLVEVPRRLEVTTCRGCAAPVFWSEWPSTGKRHLFDVRTIAVRDGKLMAQSHFATCPQADEFRSNRRGEGSVDRSG